MNVSEVFDEEDRRLYIILDTLLSLGRALSFRCGPQMLIQLSSLYHRYMVHLLWSYSLN